MSWKNWFGLNTSSLQEVDNEIQAALDKIEQNTQLSIPALQNQSSILAQQNYNNQFLQSRSFISGNLFSPTVNYKIPTEDEKMEEFHDWFEWITGKTTNYPNKQQINYTTSSTHSSTNTYLGPIHSTNSTTVIPTGSFGGMTGFEYITPGFFKKYEAWLEKKKYTEHTEKFNQEFDTLIGTNNE